ncbi:hypothetical protein ATCC90586_009418 [Pythium insidiosum]|nr:hypothetical protein ATCC90586_009418 [Pythium insidiosum]
MGRAYASCFTAYYGPKLRWLDATAAAIKHRHSELFDELSDVCDSVVVLMVVAAVYELIDRGRRRAVLALRR